MRRDDNQELEDLIEVYLADRTQDNLNMLVNHIRTCEVILPANVDEQHAPQPCVITYPKRGAFLPVYTCQEQIPREPRSSGILHEPFLEANNIVLEEPGIEGIVINPFSHKLIFKKALIERIEEVERDRARFSESKSIAMSQEQYRIYERNLFAFKNFPKTFFSHGSEMIGQLEEKREGYLNKLFKLGYKQRSVYPYTEEDFSVLVMNITGELCVLQIDLPDKDIALPACRRIYLSWNEKTKRGRYLTIEMTEDEEVDMLGEVTGDGEHTRHGEAPEEGAQLQRIIDLLLEQSIRRKDT